MTGTTTYIESKEQFIPELRFKEFDKEIITHLFSDIFNFTTGKNIKQKEASPEFETPCVRYGELYHMYSEVIFEIVNSTNLDKSELLFSKGDEILLPSAGEDPLDIGSASALTLKNIAIGRTINILRPIRKSTYSQIYTSYYINQKLRKKISTLARGASISNVYNSDLKKLKINLPSLPEQKKIASFLSAVDEKIQQLTKKKTLLEQYKKGVMKQLFSGELRFKDENGDTYSEWEEKQLGQITKINQGLQIAISERFLKPVEGSFFYITNEFLRANSEKSYYIKSPSESVLCGEDDILMTRTGNTGQVVTGVKGAFHNNFFKIKYDDYCEKWFLYYFLTSVKTQHTILKLAGTSTIPDLNHGDFYKIEINLPSIKEQLKISTLIKSLDTKIDSITSQITQTQNFKRGLLQKMFV